MRNAIVATSVVGGIGGFCTALPFALSFQPSEKAKAAGHAADDFVRDSPWKAIGAAAGIGLVIGLLIGRR